MCKMLVVVNQLKLGNRILGYEAWSGNEVVEFTEKQIKDIIREGKQKVCGLKIENEMLVLDKEGFFTTDMTVHTHIGSWKPMGDESMANNLYVCIGTQDEKGATVYNCISSRFEQAKFSEADMRAYLRIGIVSGGAKLDGDKIVLASLEVEKKEDVKVETLTVEKVSETIKSESKTIDSAPTSGSLFGKK